MPEFGLNFQDSGDAVQDAEESSDFICAHMTTARGHALTVATATDTPIVISRIVNGKRKPAIVIRPDGGAERPEGMGGEDCTKGNGRPCFCRNCRAERRARR